jgi:hypothetical protein
MGHRAENARCIQDFLEPVRCKKPVLCADARQNNQLDQDAEDLLRETYLQAVRTTLPPCEAVANLAIHAVLSSVNRCLDSDESIFAAAE